MNTKALDDHLSKYLNMEVKLPTKSMIKTLPAAHLRDMFKEAVGLPDGELSTWCQQYMSEIDNIRLGNIYHGLLLGNDNDLYVLSGPISTKSVLIQRFYIPADDVLLALCMTIMVRNRVHAFCNRMVAVNATRILTRQEQYFGRTLANRAKQFRTAA